jgi:hypothetical protein
MLCVGIANAQDESNAAIDGWLAGDVALVGLGGVILLLVGGMFGLFWAHDRVTERVKDSTPPGTVDLSALNQFVMLLSGSTLDTIESGQVAMRERALKTTNPHDDLVVNVANLILDQVVEKLRERIEPGSVTSLEPLPPELGDYEIQTDKDGRRYVIDPVENERVYIDDIDDAARAGG